MSVMLKCRFARCAALVGMLAVGPLVSAAELSLEEVVVTEETIRNKQAPSIHYFNRAA